MKIYIILNSIRNITSSFANAYEMQAELEQENGLGFGEEDENGDWVVPVEPENEDVLERYYEPEHSEWRALTEAHEFYGRDDFENFIDYYAFEIFTRAEQKGKDNAMKLNETYQRLVELGHSVTLISQERLITRPCTLIWMGTNKVNCNKIIFLDDFSQIWKDCDVVVGDMQMEWGDRPDLKVINLDEALKIGENNE